MSTYSDEKFAAIRAEFPHTANVVYFNSASYGPFCRPVREAIVANADLRMAAERDDSHDAFATADQLRETYASLIGAPTRSVGIGLNTSHGINVAAFGLPLKGGDEVLVSDIEFPAVVYTWRAAAETRGLKLTFVKSRDRMFDIDALRDAIGPHTRVVSLSWVQFFNGYRNDLKAIADLCHEHDIFFVVDGIQGMGVEPIDVEELGLDVFSSGCQKWMLAPQGCGFFYLSDRVREIIKPPFMSWLGVDWQVKFVDLFRYELPYFDSSQKFEMGYYAVLNLLGMNASAGIFRDLGIENIRNHNYALIDRLAAYVQSHPHYRVTSSMEPKHRSSIFAFTCENYKDLHKELLRNKVILVQREGSIRVSVHLFNDDSDIDRMIAVLDKFAK